MRCDSVPTRSSPRPSRSGPPSSRRPSGTASSWCPSWGSSSRRRDDAPGDSVSDPSDALASAKAAADRIVKLKRLNACLTPIKEVRKSLVVQASTAHPSGVLYGMPVAVKDNICTLEFTTSCGSKILEGYRSPYDATAAAKLKAAGAALTPKTNRRAVRLGAPPRQPAGHRPPHPVR